MKLERKTLIYIAVIFCVFIAQATHAQNKPQPLIICYGDSITAGYGLKSGESYPDALERQLVHDGYQYQVKNLGESGATSKDALKDVDQVVRLHPQVVVVEFGGNDGLRALQPEVTEKNLDVVLTTLEQAHIKVLLAGITLPPEFGSDYITRFEQVFVHLAAKHHCAFLPMIYSDVIHKAGMLQGDGVHPTVEGAKVVAKTVAQVLEPLLKK